ncbi:MAG: DUF1801 domain-containing protein [Cyclobacteriaceae bacterium]
MQNPIDEFYLSKDEPIRSCLIAMREFIKNYDSQITEAWKYRMPFFLYKGKMFCYLWINQKTRQPYVGIVEGKKIDHPSLIQEKRSRMKIMLLDPHDDLPLKALQNIFREAKKHYK